MKNRVLGLAVAIAALGMIGTGHRAPTAAPTLAPIGPAAQGSIGGAFQSFGGGWSSVVMSASGHYGIRRNNYRKHGGWSVAEGKRRANRARNRLRAKGHHRAAVR